MLMFESESDSACFFRAVWVLHDQWDPKLVYLFQGGEKVAGSLLLEQDCWVRKDCCNQYTCQVSIITYQGKLVQLLKI